MSLNGNGYHWGTAELVAQLRDLRQQSLEERQRLHRPPKLPSRKILHHIVDSLAGPPH